MGRVFFATVGYVVVEVVEVVEVPMASREWVLVWRCLVLMMHRPRLALQQGDLFQTFLVRWTVNWRLLCLDCWIQRLSGVVARCAASEL